MSLQTGTELARTVKSIVDPRNLRIVALYVEGDQLGVHSLVLHVSDIREVSDIGFIVNDSNVLMELDGLVRLQQIIEFQFELIDLPVFDRLQSKLGKVSDYAFDPADYQVQQIYIRESFIKSFSSVSNIIHRSQIISVTSERIVVESGIIKDPVSEKTSAMQALSNPFRGTVSPD